MPVPPGAETTNVKPTLEGPSNVPNLNTQYEDQKAVQARRQEFLDRGAIEVIGTDDGSQPDARADSQHTDHLRPDILEGRIENQPKPSLGNAVKNIVNKLR